MMRGELVVTEIEMSLLPKFKTAEEKKIFFGCFGVMEAGFAS